MRGAGCAMIMSPKYHQRQIEDMIQAVIYDREPLISGEESKKAVEIIYRIYKASR